VTRYTAVPPDELVQANAELVADLVREARPSLIQAATPHLNGLVGLAVARALELPFAYDVRGFPEMTLAVRAGGADSEVYRLRRAAETRCMAEADRVLTLSEAMRDHIVSRGVDPNRVRILPHAVDTERFAPAAPGRELRERLGLRGKLVAGVVSSLVEYEGVDVLLRALAQLDGVHGLVVGDGPVLPDLRRLAGELGVAGRVTFTGRVPFEQVPGHYALLDVFACPRKDYEVCRFVTPLKPFEAMAMGLCVVTSDVPALAELTNGGRTGRTFRAGSHADLAQVLGELAESPGTRRALGEAAREHVVARHGMAALIEAVRGANPGPVRPGSC
jgi:glycosyltransferase involved in cell wall biosynthesis